MSEMTRRQMKMEIQNTRNLLVDRLEGRDIQKLVDQLTERVEDVAMDEIGMPQGWETDNEDHQYMFFDMVAEVLREIYFPNPSDVNKGVRVRIEDI